MFLDDRKRIEHMGEIALVQSVRVSNASLQLGLHAALIRFGGGAAGETDDAREGAGVAREHRHRKLMNDGGRHVRAAAQTNQVVGDEAVEDAAQEPVAAPDRAARRRQKMVWVVTAPAGIIAAISVIRLVDAATSR